jgi:hypothetical protein
MAFTEFFNILGLIVAGDIGDQTIWTDRFGQKVFSKKNYPDKPASELQQAQRSRWKKGCEAWQQLSKTEKQQWEELSLRAYCSCTGFNLFMHAVLTPTFERIETLINQSGVEVQRPDYIPNEEPRDGEFF